MRRRTFPRHVGAGEYLIGKTLVHELPRVRLSGRIVETEAYPVGDRAGHAFGGRTASRESLFLPHGHAYVYFTYGSCFMMNVSSEIEGHWRGRSDSRGGAARGNRFHGAAARHKSFARSDPRSRPPRAGDGYQQALRRRKFMRGWQIMARRRRASHRSRSAPQSELASRETSINYSASTNAEVPSSAAPRACGSEPLAEMSFNPQCGKKKSR